MHLGGKTKTWDGHGELPRLTSERGAHLTSQSRKSPASSKLVRSETEQDNLGSSSLVIAGNRLSLRALKNKVYKINTARVRCYGEKMITSAERKTSMEGRVQGSKINKYLYIYRIY